MVWYSHLSKNFPQFVVIHTVKTSTVNETEVDVFLEFSCVLFNECWNFDIWFSACSQSSLYIWKFSVHVLLRASLKDFENDLSSI